MSCGQENRDALQGGAMKRRGKQREPGQTAYLRAEGGREAGTSGDLTKAEGKIPQ